MKILYDNKVKAATITSYSENPDYKFSVALPDERLCRKGRTVDDSSQWIKFDLGSAMAISYLVIYGHNLSSDATVVLEGHASDSWGAPSYSQAITWATHEIVYALTAAQTYQWWRITITDAANTATYLEIEKIYLGPALTMPGMERTQEIPRKSSADAKKSMTGQLYGDRRIIVRSASISFPSITQTQKGLIDTFFTTVDLVMPFWLLVWEDDLDVEPIIYCSLTKELGWKKQAENGGPIWALELSFEECF